MTNNSSSHTPNNPIPYHFHLIWMGQSFPYVNYLAVKTLVKHNPRAKFTIHYANPPKNNKNWDAALSLCEGIEIDYGKLFAAIESNISEAYKLESVLNAISKNYPAGVSNILRYVILYLEGGIYIDFDTLCIQSFEPLLKFPGFIGEEVVYKHDDERVSKGFKLSHIPGAAFFGLSFLGSRLFSKISGLNGLWNKLDPLVQNIWKDTKLNNAVLAAVPHHPFFKAALETIPGQDPKIKYNLGPILMNKLWEEGKAGQMMRLPPVAFYFIPPSQTHRFFTPAPEKIPHDAYCIHWCSSNHKKKASTLDETSVFSNPKGCLYNKIAAGCPV